MPFDVYKKVNIPMIYDASFTDGRLTSIRSNNLFLVAGTGVCLMTRLLLTVLADFVLAIIVNKCCDGHAGAGAPCGP